METQVDVAHHVHRVAEQGYTIVEDAIEPELVDALRRDLERLERFFEVEPAANSFEGHHTLRLYNLLAFGRVFELVPVHRHVLPIIEGVLDPGCLISSLSSISIQPGETAQPIHADDQLIPIPKPHPPTVCNSMWALTDFTEANGATRIIPARTSPTTPRLRRRLRLDRGRDAARLGADLARQPLARRRRQHHRRDAHGHRDELLRRLHPPAGEPAARPVARDRLAVLAAVARARRLQRLQHADRPHQQAVARAAPARPRVGGGSQSESAKTEPMVWDRI